VNIVQMRHKVFPILGEASASLPSNNTSGEHKNCTAMKELLY